MESLVLCRSPQTSGVLEETFPGSMSGCLTLHLAPMSSGNGTSAELAWELIDIFESGMFAFPIYDHDSARDIVRYLLERGILEEEIADAIKDSSVDMNIWLEKGDKYMVGEWVIAWINACREDYVKQKNALCAAAVVGYVERKRIGSLDGSTDSLGRQYGHMDDDDDEECADWGGIREEKNTKDGTEGADLGDGCNHELGDMCSTNGSFRGAPSFSSGLSFNQGVTESSSENMAAKWSSSSPSSPPTPFHRLAPFLRRNEQPGTVTAGPGRKAIWWRAVTSPSLQHLFQSADEKSDSGIVSDLFDRGSRDDEDEVDEKEHCRALQKSSLCNVIDASSGSRCSCKLPHYALFSTPQSDTERCLNCGKEKDSHCHASVAGLSVAHGQGQYYKDFIIRALEYTLETLDREGPGYLFILTDSEDRPITWTHEKRFRVSSSNRPELCLAAYRSRNIKIDLLWQVKVSNHNRIAADVQTVLERHRLHSNWFKCTLSDVMETVYDVITRYRATDGCHSNEP